MNILVRNLAQNITKEKLAELFGRFGKVVSSTIITHLPTGASRCFGYVEMADPDEGRAAINALHNSKLGCNKLRVKEANPLYNIDYYLQAEKQDNLTANTEIKPADREYKQSSKRDFAPRKPRSFDALRQLSENKAAPQREGSRPEYKSRPHTKYNSKPGSWHGKPGFKQKPRFGSNSEYKAGSGNSRNYDHSSRGNNQGGYTSSYSKPGEFKSRGGYAKQDSWQGKPGFKQKPRFGSRPEYKAGSGNSRNYGYSSGGNKTSGFSSGYAKPGGFKPRSSYAKPGEYQPRTGYRSFDSNRPNKSSAKYGEKSSFAPRQGGYSKPNKSFGKFRTSSTGKRPNSFHR